MNQLSQHTGEDGNGGTDRCSSADHNKWEGPNPSEAAGELVAVLLVTITDETLSPAVTVSLWRILGHF